MRRMIATACVLAMMSGGIWASQSAPQTPAPQPTVVHKTHKHDKKKKKAPASKPVAAVAPAPQVPAQTMPPLPATLMNSAPEKPKVTMNGGLLTIDAPNSTLSDVLSGVRKATGAAIEGASPTERVAVKLGPGAPEQVLAALLRGTPYDYVILGSLGDQAVVTRVLLTQAQSSPGGGQPAQGSAGPNGAGLSRPQETYQQPVDDGMPDRTPPDDATTDNAPPVEPDQAQPQPDPTQPQPEPTQAQPQAQQTPQDPNQPKTPEQLFKELQQLEQQKQQQQQQQPQR